VGFGALKGGTRVFKGGTGNRGEKILVVELGTGTTETIPFWTFPNWGGKVQLGL